MFYVGFVLVVTAGVLGGVVLILAAVYAYIYYTYIQPRSRRIHPIENLPPTQAASTQQEVEDTKMPMHPFLLYAYVAKFKRSNDASVRPVA